MQELPSQICESCKYPIEAGHSTECTKNTEIMLEYSFSTLIDELEKIHLDKNNLLTICTEDNLIGHGGGGNVYEIPGIENFVLKVNRSQLEKATQGIYPEITAVKDIFPELNIGQAIAEIPGADIQFLKRQRGIPAGVPYGPIRRDTQKADPIYEEHLKRAADMPQDSYDELARLLLIINKRKYKFDPSKANNLLIDTEAKKFNVVDIAEMYENSTYTNHIWEIIIVLMDNAYASKYKGDAPLEQYRKIVLEKCIEAGKKVGFEIPEPGENSSLDYSFKLAGQERNI